MHAETMFERLLERLVEEIVARINENNRNNNAISRLQKKLSEIQIVCGLSETDLAVSIRKLLEG